MLAEALQLFWTFLTFVLPRPVTIDENEGGILLRRGKLMKIKGSRTLSPGWVWVWPPIERVASLIVEWQATDLRIQTVWGLSVSGMIAYTVRNAERALLKARDVDDMIIKKSLVVICHHMASCKDERPDLDAISSAVLEAIKEPAMRLGGLDIKEVGITDITKARAVRHLGVDTLSVDAIIREGE